MNVEEIRPIDAPIDPEEFAAAAIELAFRDPEEPALPDALRAKLLTQAEECFAASPSTTAEVVSFPAERARAPWSHPALGWVAAAAVLLLWLGRAPESVEAPLPAPPPPVVVAAPTAEEIRTELIALDGTLKIGWTKTEDAASAQASGDVVWHSGRQGGFMRFAGLQINDPALFQYQLWIFDRDRDKRYPVDGGVFDVSSSGEVLVAIDPKIQVDDPTLFAVTVEKPGGVVVSSRERIVLVAAVEVS